MKENSNPLVIVAAPQSNLKNYCFEDWSKNVNNFTYDNYKVFLADNSKNKENVNYIKTKGFDAKHIKSKKNEALLSVINRSHQACADYVLENGAEWLLHLETDVFPDVDVIQRLLAHNRKIIGANYDIHDGLRRKSMVQVMEEYGRHVKAYRVVPFIEDNEAIFFTGGVKKVYHVGLGCVLIHRSILEQVPFRVDLNHNYHTDTWFANDCWLKKLSIFSDTETHCIHRNSTWVGV